MTWNPTPGVDPHPPSVAVVYPGNRAEKMTVPLQTTDMNVAVDPPDPYEYDLVVADNADRALGYEVLRNKLTDSLLVYRMRGDLYRELELWDMHPLKKWAAHKVVEHVDGLIAVTDFLAQKAHERSGVTPVGQAGMWIDVDAYPDSEHINRELRAVTLTNAGYQRKVAPIIEWAPVVESVLAEVGGEWRVFGDGDEGPRLSDGLASYEHVHYCGYTDDPKAALRWANVMLHPSNLDGQPNAVLEGLAGGLPVVTTDFIAFEELEGKGAPIIPVPNTSALRNELVTLSNPSMREWAATEGPEYCREWHTPEQIGQQYERYFRDLLEVKA